MIVTPAACPGPSAGTPRDETSVIGRPARERAGSSRLARWLVSRPAPRQRSMRSPGKTECPDRWSAGGASDRRPAERRPHLAEPGTYR